MKKKERYQQVLACLSKQWPAAETELHFSTTFQLLVSVVLSAQCTDRRVNEVTPRLFHDYPTAEAMAAAEPDVIFDYVRSVSYPNSKARYLVGLSRLLMENHGGEVPHDLKALTALPGVGRKTANVVLSVAFGQAALAVDTHVFRVSHRLGLVGKQHDTPRKVEDELTRHIPAGQMASAHHWLLLHGRYTCTARRPNCQACSVAALCPSRDKVLPRHDD